MITNGKIQLFPLIRIAIMLITGIIAGNQTDFSFNIWAVLSSVSLVLSFVIRKPISQSTVIMATAFFIGGLLVSLENNKLKISLPENHIAYEGVLASQPVEKNKVIQFDLIVTKIPSIPSKDFKPFKVKCSILKDTTERKYKHINVGDGIKAYSRFEYPANFKQSNFNYAQWLRSNGFSATTFIYYSEWEKAVINIGNLSYLERTIINALKLRQRLLTYYKASIIDEEQYSVIAAMTLGDKSAISKETKEIYSISGASHILALSGLHLSIIYSILSLLSFAFRKRYLSQSVILISIWAYAVITGLSPSVLRASVMLTIFSFVSLMDRNNMSANTLAFTAIVMLVYNPLYAFDVGFQMSFIAVLSILIFYKPIYNIVSSEFMSRHRLLKHIWSFTAVSLSAQICTAPLVAFYFERFSCYSILTNFLAIPCTIFILYTSFLFLILFFSPALQSFIAEILSYSVALLNNGLTVISSLPFASIDNININVVQLIFIYISIGCIYFLCRYLNKMIAFNKDIV